MAEETPAKDSIQVYSESAAELDTQLDKPTFESVAEPSFSCACEDWMRSACAGAPFYKGHEGKRYCVLHYPGKEKSEDFARVYQSKIAAGDYNFGGVWFPDVVNLRDFEFKSDVEFSNATFSEEASFSNATFSAAADFSGATFSAAYFSSATFLDEIKFSGKESFGIQSSLDLQSARIEKPERVFFHTVTLRPHWFVNVDPRKFVFIDVSWPWDAISIEDEIESLTVRKKDVSSPHRLLAIACRQLAENAEANNRYEEASRFRYWAMDLARQYKWQGKAFLKTDWLHMLYWAVSGYGERILRAFAWILAIWIIFALLYTKVGFIKPDGGDEPLPFKRAFTYSLAVMSLQKPEPRPLTNTAQTLVLLETILGPVQAALLALAIRRKFMR